MTLAHRRHGQRRHLNWAWDAYWSRCCRWMMGRINQLHCGPRESSEPGPIQPSCPPDTSTRRCWRVFPVCFVCVSVNTRWFPSPRGPHFSAQLLDGKASIRSMEGPFRQQWRLLYQLISSNNSLPILGILLFFLLYTFEDGQISIAPAATCVYGILNGRKLSTEGATLRNVPRGLTCISGSQWTLFITRRWSEAQWAMDGSKSARWRATCQPQSPYKYRAGQSRLLREISVIVISILL